MKNKLFDYMIMVETIDNQESNELDKEFALFNYFRKEKSNE